MSAMRRLLARVSAFFQGRELDADLDEELAAHVELAVEENLKQGMSAQETRRKALVSLGRKEAAKELHRDSRGLPALEAILQDLRFAFRILAKRPWLTTMVVLVLAAGIGVNTTVFTLFNALYIRGLPFPDGNRVLFVENNNLTKNQQRMRTSYPDFADWRAEVRAFADLGGFSRAAFNLSDDSAAPASPTTRFVSSTSRRFSAAISSPKRTSPARTGSYCSATASGKIATAETRKSLTKPCVSTSGCTRSSVSCLPASTSPLRPSSGFRSLPKATGSNATPAGWVFLDALPTAPLSPAPRRVGPARQQTAARVPRYE